MRVIQREPAYIITDTFNRRQLNTTERGCSCWCQHALRSRRCASHQGYTGRSRAGRSRPHLLEATAHLPSGQARAHQALHEGTGGIWDEVLREAIDTRTATVLAWVVVFAVVHVTILLLLRGLATGRHLSNTHRHGALPSAGKRFASTIAWNGLASIPWISLPPRHGASHASGCGPRRPVAPHRACRAAPGRCVAGSDRPRPTEAAALFTAQRVPCVRPRYGPWQTA